MFATYHSLKAGETGSEKIIKLQEFIYNLMEFREKIKPLLRAEKERPYDITVHEKLARLYLSVNYFEKAEEEQEAVEMLSRIKRLTKRGG